MARRSRITRMDRWDVFPRSRFKGEKEPVCDLVPRIALHRIGALYYISTFRRTRKGTPFSEIKGTDLHAELMADTAIGFLRSFIGDPLGWAILTTPRRRHHEGYHLATDICGRIADALGIRFYRGAVQCLNRQRIDPEFHLLRPIEETRVIVYDDIVTTGSTLTATASLLTDCKTVLNLIGISNR